MWTSTSSGHVLARDASFKLYQNVFAVRCPCDRARCLVGSLRLDLRSDSGKKQLDDHVEVVEDIILPIMFLSNVVWFTASKMIMFTGGFLSMQLDQKKSWSSCALCRRGLLERISCTCFGRCSIKHLCCRQLEESSGQPVLSSAHVAVSLPWYLLALAVGECRGTVCDQFDVSETLDVLGLGDVSRSLVGSPLGLRH